MKVTLHQNIVNNQRGFVLIIALMMLVILSLLGIATLNTTDVELKIAGNERQEKQIFYGAESGCVRGGQWLRNLQLEIVDDYADQDLMASYISDQNYTTEMVVRDVAENEESNLGDSNYPVKYRYSIAEQFDSTGNPDCRPIPGNNPNILNCFYKVSCSINTSNNGGRQLEVVVAKPTNFN